MGSFMEKFDSNSYNKKEKKHDNSFSFVIFVKNNIKKITIALLVVCISISGYFVWVNSINRVPNFISKPLSEVQIWGLKNGVNISVKEEYLTSVEKKTVISQSVPQGSALSSKDDFEVIVSAGGDPDENIDLKNINSMIKEELEQFKKQNDLYNMHLVYNYDENILENKIINIEFSDTETGFTNYRRKDIVTIYISKGKENYQAHIEVPNFHKKSVTEVEEWGSKNDIEIKTEYVTSNYIDQGSIVGQNINPKEKIKKRSILVIEVSAGKPIVIPDYSKFNLYTIQQSGTKDQLEVFILEKYSSDKVYGEFISQDIPAGTIYSMDNIEAVSVYFSVGRPYIDNLIGMKENELLQYLFKLENMGVHISYTVSYQATGDPTNKGTILSASKNAEYIEMNEHIHIVVSSG